MVFRARRIVCRWPKHYREEIQQWIHFSFACYPKEERDQEAKRISVTLVSKVYMA